MDVYYFTKTNQILLTHLSNFLISFYNEKKFLEIVGKDINGLVQFTLKLNSNNSANDNNAIKAYNEMLDDYKERIDEFNNRIEIFYEKDQPFAALLPLKELNRYEYSLNTQSAKINIQTIPIFVLADALNLLISGKVKEGSILLDAVGKIKIAYLGVLLISFENDRYAEKKFEILQRDLIEYYAFVDKILWGCEWQLDMRLHIDRSEIPNYVEERLNQYERSEGIFKYGIYKELDRYYNSETLEDYFKYFSDEFWKDKKFKRSQ